MSWNRQKSHGKSQTKTYKTWATIKTKCLSKKDKTYGHIDFPESWLSFETFLQDMGEALDRKILCRKDLNKGYSKENCFWGTHADRNRNRTQTIEIDGESRAQIAKKLGMKPQGITTRLREGWSIDKIKSTPKDSHLTQYMYQEKLMTLSKISTLCGISESCLRNRIYRGWTMEKSTTVKPFKNGKKKNDLPQPSSPGPSESVSFSGDVF